ncbi:MAG: ParB N-terminal domain-containing protein [Candidatus Bathyarchaeota archaeon]|nr:MAG: ParB N-terminal domain-containing protein [Candidatus Bathyarchaeota archaeon]
MVFKVSHPNIELELQLCEIDKLHIHEEIITESVEKLIKAFKKDRYAKHPILVDKETLVVLDGMHRTWAFKHLGYKLIPVCLMDYNNPNIMVKSWFRTIIAEQKTSRDLHSTLQELGYLLHETTEDELQRKIDNKQWTIGIVTAETCYGIVGKTKNTKETYEYIKHLETNLESVRYMIGYETREDAIRKAKEGTVLAAVTAPQITKQDVVDVALAGEVFVHKATRHVIPARPLFMNVPFTWMNLESKEANKRLVEHLTKKKLKRLPPGQTLDRRYEEELYIFE